MIFKWFKKHGCNCCPIEAGAEHYFLGIGGIYEASVRSIKCEHEDGFYWEWKLIVAGRNRCGGSGGGAGRDESMDDTEERIASYLVELGILRDGDQHQREIYDSLVEVDEATGAWSHRRLP